MDPVCRHEVRCLDAPQRSDILILVAAVVTLNADGADGQEYRECLRDFRIPPRRCNLLEGDMVDTLQDVESLGRDLAHDADRQPWSGKRVSPGHIMR